LYRLKEKDQRKKKEEEKATGTRTGSLEKTWV
jgi:hypothetical protein